jgi:hypothetical protein
MKSVARGPLEWLLVLGSLTLFIWPFMQLWSVQAVPLFVSDAGRQAALALENLLAEARARPGGGYERGAFKAIPGGEKISLEGRVEVLPHPSFGGMDIIRARVRWGGVFFRKHLILEAIVNQDRA